MLGSLAIRISDALSVVLFWQFKPIALKFKLLAQRSIFVCIESKHSTELSFSIHLNV